MIRFSALLFALFATCVSFAQSPYLVKDINTTTNGLQRSSNPSEIFADGNAVYIAAGVTTGAIPYLWKYANGQLLRLSNTQNQPSQPLFILPKGDGTFFFMARGLVAGSQVGWELWKTDGTPEGTSLIKDIFPGSSSSLPQGFVLHQGLLYFSAESPTYGREAWVSDGTTGGTHRLKNLWPGPSASLPIGVVDNRVAILGKALWLSDGTDAGTTMVREWTSVPGRGTVAGSKVFVVANDGTSGNELWVSDGTTAGTQRVTDFVQSSPSPFGASPTTLTPLGNGVLFYADDGAGQVGLWFSDGTSAGTTLVWSGAQPTAYRVTEGLAYFNSATQLFRTDGTLAGTYALDVRAQNFPVSAFGAAYYVIDNGDGTSALRRTDGTIGGTSTTMTFPAGTTVNSMSGTGGKLFFNYTTPAYGAEPWVSNDGTSIELLVNIATDALPSSMPSSMTGTDAGAVFFAYDGVKNDVWFSDGTSAGTIPLGLPHGSGKSLVRVGSRLFFQIDTSWWTSDGTVAGTTPISFFAPGSGESVRTVFAASDRLYLVTHTGLYVCDGTTTQQLSPTDASALSTATNFAEHFGRVNFETNDSRLWETRGTTATTRVIGLTGGTYAGGAFYTTRYNSTTLSNELVRFDETGASVVLGNFEAPAGYRAAGRYVYFVNLMSLWRTDGTAAGTIELGTIFGSSTFAVSGDSAYFVHSDAVSGIELWRTDGTVTRTTVVKDIVPGNGDSLPQLLNDAWGSFWFTADDGVHGRELWRTDGTEAGTVMVADIAPSSGSSSPSQLTKAGSRLFFTANDGVTGVEPWAIALEGSALSIADVRVTEGNAGTTNMRFTVTREGDLSQIASAAFATENGSAGSGTDYVAATGTVSFGVGESTAAIDITIQNDTITETNETMYVVLSSPSGTTLARPRALGLIEDNDARVDLALELIPTAGNWLKIRVTNNASLNATGVQVRITDSPAMSPSRTATFPIIAPGSSATVSVAHSSPSPLISQRNLFILDVDAPTAYTTTATVTSNEEELNPADNTKSVMSNATATVVLPPYQTIGTTKPGSMYATWSGGTINGDALVSITPGSVPATGQPVDFTLVAGNVAGSALIQGNDGSYAFTFHYPIVNPGQTPKLATAASAFVSAGNYGTAIPVKIFIRGARHDGVRPTGIVTIKANGGGVLTQLPLDADGSISFSRSNLSAGTWGHWIEYAGDANFLPMRGQFFVEVNQAPTTITGSLTRTSCYIAEGKLTVKAASGTIAPEGRIAVTFGVNTVYLTLVPTGQPGEAAVMARVQLPSNNTTLMYTYQPAQFSQYAYSATNQTIAFADCTSVATALYVMTPCRILDTRDSTMLANYATRVVQAAGRCGIPADARAISGNVTAVSPGENGFLRMLPSGVLPIPDVSTMSYRRGKTRANNTIILLNSDGALDAYNGGPNPVHFIIDVYAYFK